MKKQLSILKIGGKILNDEAKLSQFLKKAAQLKGKKIIVHGGGRAANQLCQKLGITPKMHEGRRITDAPTLDVVTMVYAGLLNKKVVSQLQALGCNAIGLTGADGNSILAKKRGVQPIDYGFAGDVCAVNKELIINLLNSGLTPIFCSITHNQQGQLLNTNADTIATEVARVLANDFKVNLTFCFEKEGVLTNPNDEFSVIEQLSKTDYHFYKKSGAISDGMIPKIDNAFWAKEKGVEQVFISKTEIL